MVDLSEIPLELRPALAVFLQELESHMTYLNAALSAVEAFASGEDLLRSHRLSEAQMLEHRFHVIKGGASFFKLDRIRDAAAYGEELFKHGDVHTTEPSRLVFELKEIMNSFGEQAEALRECFSGADLK